MTDSHLYYGDLYFSKKNYKKAIFHFKKGHQLASNNNYTPLKKYAAQLLSKSYDSIANYKKSLAYYIQYTQLKDSILNTSTNSKIAELEIEYETEKKEKQIVIQKEKILLSEIKVKNRTLYATIFGFGLFLLALVSSFIYKYQQKKRAELQKQLILKDELSQVKLQNNLQQQRLNISRDLHDNIGAQLTFIISSIDNLMYTAKNTDEKLKTRLTAINQFTSNTIYQLRDTIWAMNKNEISLTDFYSRALSYIEKAKQASGNVIFNIENTVKSNIILPNNAGINVYRVIQEAINNSLKYANATHINIKIKETEQKLHFYIEDDGSGFDKNTVEIGNGLSNMQKRIEDIGGETIVTSSPNNGTTITIALPKNTLNVV